MADYVENVSRIVGIQWSAEPAEVTAAGYAVLATSGPYVQFSVVAESQDETPPEPRGYFTGQDLLLDSVAVDQGLDRGWDLLPDLSRYAVQEENAPSEFLVHIFDGSGTLLASPDLIDYGSSWAEWRGGVLTNGGDLMFTYNESFPTEIQLHTFDQTTGAHTEQGAVVIPSDFPAASSFSNLGSCQLASRDAMVMVFNLNGFGVSPPTGRMCVVTPGGSRGAAVAVSSSAKVHPGTGEYIYVQTPGSGILEAYKRSGTALTRAASKDFDFSADTTPLTHSFGFGNAFVSTDLFYVRQSDLEVHIYYQDGTEADSYVNGRFRYGFWPMFHGVEKTGTLETP